MLVKKLREDAIIPTIAYDDDAGFDVYAIEDDILYPGESRQYKLGIAIEIEIDEVAIISERSGMAIKYGITSIGNIIDSGYRGEISIILTNIVGDHDQRRRLSINKGDKIGQIVVCKLGSREILEVDKLSNSIRGSKAHNSSGK